MISLLQAENITKSYGEVVLFEDISMSIHKDRKIALIAKNGAGKTSLLNIIHGQDTPDSGQIISQNDITIGFLQQNPDIDLNSSVLQAVFSSSSDIIKAISDYESAIQSDDQNLIQVTIDEMDRLKAWDYEVKVKQILNELKISSFDQQVNELSGGQKKRLALANVLINEPDLLILDEPTNHLDLEMIEWLEGYLQKSKCTLFMVTHDRYFLDRVCNEIIELDNKELYTYRGNYSYYLEKREERLQIKNVEIDKSRSLLKKELDWMRRSPLARTTKAKYRINAFYELEEKASQRKSKDRIQIDIKSSRLGKKILNIFSIYKSFDELKILDDFSYLFKPYEKIGIVGNNGTGKTTLLDIITGLQPKDAGKIEVGETVVFGYYKQDGMKFKESQVVIDAVKDIAEVVNLGDGRKLTASGFLNHFLFPPKMQHQYISKLSGGEKRRLYLLTVLMQNPNFLILDEPTNDLDILTLNVLEDYLQTFKGCLLIVSHDRYFMDKVVDNLFVFEGNGAVRNFPGNYTEYNLKVRQKQRLHKSTSEKKPVKSRPVKDKPRKLSFNEKREFELVERDLKLLDNEKKEIENSLGSGSLPPDELILKSTRLGKILDLIEEKEMRWLELSEIGE